MKFCKDCKHYRQESNPQYDRCGHPELCCVDLVRGQADPGYCIVQRMHNAPCGHDALKFEAKQ